MSIKYIPILTYMNNNSYITNSDKAIITNIMVILSTR